MSKEKQNDSSKKHKSTPPGGYLRTQEFRDAVTKAVREGHKDQQKFMRENGYKDW